MENLKETLEKLFTLNDSEWKFISESLIEKHVKPKEQLIKSGQIAPAIFLIKNGLLRVYHLLNGKEISTYFSCDEQFISTYTSFVTQKPSFEILEAIEESTVYSISYKTLEQLYKMDSKFEKLGRFIAEQNYLCISNRTLIMQTKTAKEKYLDFIATTPKRIVQQVPQHQIASFLGIAPESLSRVRKEILIS
jgi:CRP-like cAMP-binding protein